MIMIGKGGGGTHPSLYRPLAKVGQAATTLRERSSAIMEHRSKASYSFDPCHLPGFLSATLSSKAGGYDRRRITFSSPGWAWRILPMWLLTYSFPFAAGFGFSPLNL